MARRRAPKPVFERTSRGYVINLDPEEIDLVARLLGELRGLIMAEDPSQAALLRRLFPPAYHLADDAEAEAEYQRLMREDLVASRLAALNLVQEHLTRGTPLDDEAMLGMVQSLNGVRLVLGTLIDVGEGEDPSEIPDDHPLVGEHHLYHFLSYLLEVGVQALSE